MSSRPTLNARDVVPGTAPISDVNLRVKNAEREAIFAKIKVALPHGTATRAAAITAKFQELDTMISEIASREQMSREEILFLVKNQSNYTFLHVAAEYGRDGKSSNPISFSSPLFLHCTGLYMFGSMLTKNVWNN